MVVFHVSTFILLVHQTGDPDYCFSVRVNANEAVAQESL